MDPSRLKTIENIRRNVAAGEFNRKAEPGDPQLDAEQLDTLLRANVGSRKRLPYRLRNFAARVIAGVFSRIYNRGTRFEGLEKIRSIKGPAIITSNHFDFLDCTVMHELGRRAWHRHIIGLSQATNFAMGGFLGFILKYYDMIPVFKQKEFMAEVFEPLMDEAVRDGRFILIYPEQEMWWHYRKPRPPKRGAYLYAAKYGVPLIPCFTEMTELSSIDRFGVRRLRYTVHIGDPVYPDPALSERENSFAMMQADYAFKKAAYERAYGRPLDYSFGGFDIAGVQYYSSFDCDMVGGTAQDCALPEDYEWIAEGAQARRRYRRCYRLYRAASQLYRLFSGVRLRNREVFDAVPKGGGAFIFSNHTLTLGDALTPPLSPLSRRHWIVCSPANFAVPLIGRKFGWMGALPTTGRLSDVRKLSKAISRRYAEGGFLTIYPEAHLWPYCSFIRPFSDTSFSFPAELMAPCFSATTVFTRRRPGSRPRITIYFDGPFWPDADLPPRKRREELARRVREAMEGRSALSDCSYIDYLPL